MNPQSTYFMAFLDTAGGDLAEYRHKYLTGLAVGRTGLRPVAVEPPTQTSIRVNAADRPPLADPEALRVNFPAEVGAYLDKALPVAIRNFRDRFPLLPGEAITQDTITALTAEWHQFPKGTVIYRRQTNVGTIAFGILTMAVDIQTGATSYRTPETVAPQQMPADLQSVAMSESDKTVIDAALTIATFAGFALGPEGLILSGGAAVLQMIFDRCMSQNQVPLSEQVADAVKVVSVELNLENINATIGTDYDWLRNRYDAAWVDHPAPISDEEYQDFKRHLSDKLAADTGIMHDVNLLGQPSYRIPGFPLYLLGASLVLLLMKIDVLIRSSEKSVVDTNAFTTLINTLKSYINTAEATKAAIDKNISDRLGQISVVYRDQGCVTISDPTPDTACWANWTYNDGPEVFRFPDAAPPDGGCFSQVVEHKSEAEASRATYYANVRSQLNNRYYRGDPQKAADTIAQWKSMLQEYQGYLPSQ